MPALFRLYQTEAPGQRPTESRRRRNPGTLANLHHLFEVQQTLFNGAAESGAVGDFLAEHLVVGAGMRIDMNQANRAMFCSGAQNRQGDGVVSPRVSGMRETI